MTDWHDMTALAQGEAIGGGTLDPVALTEHYLERIAAGDRDRTTYITVTRERALAEAAAARARAQAGHRRSPLDGVPISWKDLFDSAGVRTTGGSPLLAERVPVADAEALARATRAGLVCLGKTTLTELAYSGLGINPSFGTPTNPFDATTARVPGGSSSGAASSVARGLAAAGIGSDTGGSVRIPAAWHGLVGLKTTFGAIPGEGIVPLWPDVDTVGPLTRDVADAAALFAILARRAPTDLGGARLTGMRILVPTNVVWEQTEPGVAAAVEAGLERLARAGARIERARVRTLDALAELGSAPAVLMSAEAYAVWRELLEARPDAVYKPVLERFRMGRDPKGPDVIATRMRISEIAAEYLSETAGFDAVATPTAPIAPPPLEDLLPGGDAYVQKNMLTLRNTRIGNLLALSAVTLPCGRTDGLPVGLMLMGRPHREAALLRLAKAAEAALAT